MARNLLHKDQLEAFLAWCGAHDIPWHRGAGQYQEARVRPRPDRAIWESVYTQPNNPEFLGVTAGLEHTVRRFLTYHYRQERQHVADQG